MSKVIFHYNGNEIIIPCQNGDKMKEICKKFEVKSQNNINKLAFLYGGNIVDLEKTFEQIISKEDKNANKIKIIVISSNKVVENKNIELKEIICPECFEPCLINIFDYKINLMNCKNDHYNTSFFEEFHKTQNINLFFYTKITCDDCKVNNRGTSFKNAFYKCLTCKQKICPLCKSRHKNHKIISYDDINYICNEHNEKYDSYCKDCKVNLCIYCKHNEDHNIINFKDIIIKDEADYKNIKKENEEFKLMIEKFNNEITELENILKIFKKVKDNFDI